MSTLAYHQLLTREADGPDYPTTGVTTGVTTSIRDFLGISPDHNVLDLSFNALWDTILNSLDGGLDEPSGKFLLIVCGDLRERSLRKTSWA
jgi:hypothetical protein